MELLFGIIPFTFYIYKVNRLKELPIYKIILFWYLIGMCSAFYLWNYTDLFKDGFFLNPIAIIYQVAVIMILLYPVRDYERYLKPSTIESIPYKTLSIFLYALILISLISIISSISIINNLAHMNVSDIRTEVMIGGEGREMKQAGSILSHISALASNYSFISLILSFYCMLKYPYKKRIIYLLLMSSLSYLFFNLEIGGREAIVRYSFDLLFVYLIFRKDISNYWRHKFRVVMLSVFILMLMVALYITISRFDGKNTMYGTLGYLGQGFIFFSRFFDYFGKTGSESAIFNAFSLIQVDRFNQNINVSADFFLNVFTTFVGSFVKASGYKVALIHFAIIYFFIVLVKRINKKSIFYYIYAFYIFRFFIGGIFYWIDSFASRAKVYYILLIFLIHFITVQFRKQRKIV